MYSLLPFLFLLFVPFSQQTAIDLVCLMNKTLPAYQPNVYVCEVTQSCCINQGEYACCKKDANFAEILHQSILCLAFTVSFLGVALVVQWYFNDENPTTEGGLIDCREQREQATRLVFPKLGEDIVADPLFGTVYNDRPARYATGGHSKGMVWFPVEWRREREERLIREKRFENC